MTTSQSQSKQGFESTDFEFYRDESGQLVSIPTTSDLEGYLAFDTNQKSFVQVRLLKTDDPQKMDAFSRIWNRVKEANDSCICPEILAFGKEGDIPYYISSLPPGEPVSQFIHRQGPMPAEVAANLLLKFIRTIQNQDPVLHTSFAMEASSIWIARAANTPKIILGDFSPTTCASPEVANTKLCIHLFKYLSGNPPFNEAFQNFCSSIESGPQTLGFLAEKLESYSKSNPTSQFWTDYNQPDALLHQIVPPEVAIQTAPMEFETQSTNKSKRLILPYLVLAALIFGLLTMTGLLFITKDKASPVAALKDRISERFNKEDNPLAKVDPETEAVPVESETVIESPEKELITEIPAKDKTRESASLTTYEPETLILPDLTPVEEEDTNSEEKSAKLAELARSENRFIDAIDHEIEIISQNPGEVGSKVRLHDDLEMLQLAIDRPFEADEIKILEKASLHNSKAFDILVKHYRNSGNWNKEIQTLVTFSRAAKRADKLSAAGERMFQNPTVSEGDKKLARDYFLEAAKEGDRDGQFFAGECLVLGRGGDKNPTQGTYYLRKAADQGDARAMDLLGVCYVRSWGVNRDDFKAVKLFQQAIGAGNIPAYYNLGARYAQGQGVDRDPSKAADIFEEGSRKGNAHCMLVFGRCFEVGFGRNEDHNKAVYWFSKSAEKGNLEAIEWCNNKHIDYLKVLAES